VIKHGESKFTPTNADNTETTTSKTKGGEIRDTKTLNLSRNIVSLQVLVDGFPFFTARNQLVAQQKHLLRVEESCCEK